MSDNQHDEEIIQQATRLTLKSLQQALQNDHRLTSGSSLISVGEREELIKQIAQILPAGNVLNFIVNGILHAKDREISSDAGSSHLRSLLKGLSIVRDNAYYRMVFGGPATLLAGYNMLLRLTGSDIEEYLPDGTWQFYVEFGLREDSARHSSETFAFQRAAVYTTESAQLAAWMFSAMQLLHDYDDLIGLIWEEQVRLSVLEATTGLTGLYRIWQQIRPFGVPSGESDDRFVNYRRKCLDVFCFEQLGRIGVEQRQNYEKEWLNTAKQREYIHARTAYQRQMSIRAFLEAGEYSEKRVALPTEKLFIAVIYQESYYLLDLIDPIHPHAYTFLYRQAQQILKGKGEPAQLDLLLTQSPRYDQPRLRRLLDAQQQKAIGVLRQSPIILNWDMANADQPLTRIRSGHRGIGDHALTIFRADKSMVFDFSHIYFDGPWAMAVAEILTNQAVGDLQLSENLALNNPTEGMKQLSLGANPKLRQAVEKFPRIVSHISAEAVTNLAPITKLRQLLAKRTRPAVPLTVNDLLVLYRTLFNQFYQPSAELQDALRHLQSQKGGSALADDALEMLKHLRTVNPSMMIPIDAGRVNPKERIFPSTFRSPFPDLRLEHQKLLSQLETVKAARLGRKKLVDAYNESRTQYLGALRAFSELMRRYRDIAIEGQSMSTTAIRLIAGLPGAMQRLADGIPGKFSFVNEAIKGEEVFSNVGQVVPGSSLSRFVSAKDDNDKKVLVWGIMTDSEQRLVITLRDFRPQVTALSLAGHDRLAQQVTQDFLHGYVVGLNEFVQELTEILNASTS